MGGKEMVGLENLPKNLLSDERTKELIFASQRGDSDAKEILVHHNLRLVLKMVHRFKDRGYELDDLFQIGTMGLLQAINKFDLERGVKFSTYAVPLIIGEIMRFFRDDSSLQVSRSIQKISQEIRELEEDFRQQQHRQPTILEISSILGLSPCEIVEAMEGVKKPVSIQQQVDPGDTEKEIYLIEQLADQDLSKDKLLEHLDLRQVIQGLPPREKKILYLRFFKEMTQEEIGKILGLSQVQISRLVKKILHQLQRQLQIDTEYLSKP